MRSSKPTIPTARPIPRSVQSSPCPETISPSSPRSPVTPYSPPTQGSNNGYFSGQASGETSSPPSDRTILGRISSFSKRNGDRPRSRSPRPLPERSATVSVTQTSRKSSGSPTQPSSPKARHRDSGTFTDCGRHSNDWLFNGFSVTSTVKGLFNDSGKN